MAGEPDEAESYLYKGIAVGGGSSAANPTSQEKHAQSSQAQLLDQERDRISQLQSASKSASKSALEMMGISEEGSSLGKAVDAALAYDDTSDYLTRTYTQEEWEGEQPKKPTTQDPSTNPKWKYAISGDKNAYGREVLGSKSMNSAHENQSWEQYLSDYQREKQAYDKEQSDYQSKLSSWKNKGTYTEAVWKSEEPTKPTGNPRDDPKYSYAFSGDVAGWAKTKGWKTVSSQSEWDAWNAYQQEAAQAEQAYQAKYQQYLADYQTWQGKQSQIGTAGSESQIGQQVTADREDYEAATIASLVKQIEEYSGEGEFTKEFEDRLRSALEEIPEETAAKQALLDRVEQLTSSEEGVAIFNNLFKAVKVATEEGGKTSEAIYARIAELTGPDGQKAYQDLVDRVNRAAAGERPVDAATERELSRQETNLSNTLRKQLGPGWETSTAGTARMGDYQRSRTEAIQRDQSEGLQNAIDALSSYSGLVEQEYGNLEAVKRDIAGATQNLQDYQDLTSTALSQYYSLEGAQQQRISDAIGNLNEYQQGRDTHLNNLITNLQQYEGGIFKRESDIANAYYNLSTAPYQDSGSGDLASQYGEYSQSLSSSRAASNSSQKASGASGAISGAVSGAAAGATVGGGWGALAGAVIGAAGGYYSSQA